jgi:hypothetical protein
MKLNLISVSFIVTTISPLVTFSFSLQTISSHKQQQQQHQRTKTILSSTNDYLGNLRPDSGPMGGNDDRVVSFRQSTATCYLALLSKWTRYTKRLSNILFVTS